MHRSTTARALIICTMVLGLSSLASPASAGHDSDDPDGYSDEYGSEEYGSDERAGHGWHLEIEVECDSVEATSSHRISTVTVYFADGTEEEIEVDEREYSATFTDAIDHAVAESHKEWVVDEAEDCEAEPEPSGSPTDSSEDDDGEGDTDPADEDGSDEGDDSSNGDTSTGPGGTDGGATRDGTDGDRDATRGTISARTSPTGDSTDGATSSSVTSGRVAATTAPRSPAYGSGLTVTGSAEVFGMVFHQGIKTCPSGPFKGMPYVDLKDCGDSVLGTRLALTGSGTGIFTALGLGMVALGTVLLRLRRART